MSQILVVRSSANGQSSVSNQLIDLYLAAVSASEPRVRVVERDLDREPIAHVTSAMLAGIGRAAPETLASQDARVLSDTLIAEVQAADTLVIGLPMYNFGIPSTLKSWFDHIIRAGVTFRYTEAGPEGLVVGKRAIVVVARRGAYSEGERAALDHQIPHVRTLLGFIGITDVEIVLAEGLGLGEEAAAASIAAAKTAIEGLVRVPA